MSRPLEGIKVYVDVRSSDGKANYSSCVSNQLKLLGAEIHSTLTQSCTHVVFKDGKINTRLQGNKLGISLVNVLWVERCRETNSKCDESMFPVTDDHVDTPVNLRKTRARHKSFQPSDVAASKSSKTRKVRKPKLTSDAVESPADSAPLKHKPQLIKKLQWPPDHSDVCSEAELAVHEEIGEDMKSEKKRGKRKLKKSGVFDQSMGNSQGKLEPTTSATDLFVISKDSTAQNQNKEDSQFSSYDASQHFERTDYSVTNMIKQLDATIDKSPVRLSNSGDVFADLYSDSDDGVTDSPTKNKRTCLLTNSQKNVMDKTFEFDEIDRWTEQKKIKKQTRKIKKHSVCKTSASKQTKEDLKKVGEEITTHVSVLNSPTKMLTFSSNYADNSDIVTDIEAEALGANIEEVAALQRIKSPVVVKSKKTKHSKTRISKSLLRSDDSALSCNEPKTKRGSKKAKIPPSLPITHNDLNLSQSNENQNINNRNMVEDLMVPKNPSTQSSLLSAVVQAPEITSTSEANPRRISKRIRHSSSKMKNPDFVYQSLLDQSSGKIKGRKNSSVSDNNTPSSKANTAKLLDISENSICSTKESEDTISPLSAPGSTQNNSTRPSPTDSNLIAGSEISSNSKSLEILNEVDITTRNTRRSGRMRKSNPKYTSSDTSTSKLSKVAVQKEAMSEKQSEQQRVHPSPEQCVTSEYSTTETPGVKKKKTITRRDKKLPVIPTTTDTEESASERVDKRPSSKRKKPKRESTGEETAIVKRRSSGCLSNTNQIMICTTCCHRDDQAMVRTTAKSFSAAISESVVRETTHVVMGTPKRTINLLKAIIHGAYVLSLEWITDSISKDAWQKESKYELVKDFPILKMKRDWRRKAASLLFAEVGLIFVDKDTAPPQADLIDLITLCGGKVTKSRTRSRYCIGGAAQDKDHISLSEQWILDSISNLRIQKTNKFLLFPYRSPSPEF